MNNKKQKKSNPLGLVVGIIIVISYLSGSEGLRKLFARIRWMIQTGRFGSGRFGSDPRIWLIVLAGVVLSVAIALVARAAQKAAERKGVGTARGGGTAELHSHDRLQGYAGNEKSDEHWKKQLDGFLAAGIIDRSEYRTLLERRRR